jgi:hypothetical protein
VICVVEPTIVGPVQPGTTSVTEPKKRSSPDELSSRAYVAHKSSRQRASTCADVHAISRWGCTFRFLANIAPWRLLAGVFCCARPPLGR